MSFVYYPTNQEMLVKDARYSSRAQGFSWTAFVISLVSLAIPCILPLGLVFTYLAYRNSVQATKKGFRYNQFNLLRIIAFSPFIALIGITLYWISIITTDTSGGWAALGVFFIVIFAIPFAFIANIVGFFTTYSMRRKDGVKEPLNAGLIMFKIVGYLSFTASLAFIAIGGMTFIGNIFS